MNNRSQANSLKQHNSMMAKNVWCKTSFWIGIVSIFLGGFIGIIPLVGLIFSIIGLTKFNKEVHSGLWMGIAGLILNLLYLLVNSYMNGHIG
ncbi:hypothetical protein [Virgibacillus sp. DJP39]|uniref:hypothetical protein n=1 Tax=Virgibacillus sp. DJP39 TaxID=3409790 RepID=UPI003BB6AF4E